MLSSKFSFQLVSKKKLLNKSATVVSSFEKEKIHTSTSEETVDEDKRKFLKLAGIAGAGLVASQFIPGKASALIMGSTPASTVVGLKDSTNTRIDPAKDATVSALGTTLTGIKGQTDKFTFDGSNNLYVNAATGFSSQLENASSVVINPATEDTLALIKAQTNKLLFDISGNLLTTTSGGIASFVGVRDTTNTQINPATDDAVVYLRRIVKLMESQAVVDSGNRQRITLDSIGANTAITTTLPVTVSGTVATTLASTTVTSISAGTNIIGGVTIDGQGRQMFTEAARQAYNSGIRSNLIFS